MKLLCAKRKRWRTIWVTFIGFPADYRDLNYTKYAQKETKFVDRDIILTTPIDLTLLGN
jgi:hypothetical protein